MRKIVRNTIGPVLAGLAVLIAILGTAVLTLSGAPVASDNFRQTRIELPDVELLDRHARPVKLAALLPDDALVVVNFSYTTCESICPLGNQILQFVDERRTEVGQPVRLVSITIDPTTDTPERMDAAARSFGASADWYWLTGSGAAIDRVLRSAGANVADIQLHDPIFLVGNPDSGRFYRSLSMPDADELIAMLSSLRS